jgi:hypothetical protein
MSASLNFVITFLSWGYVAGETATCASW